MNDTGSLVKLMEANDFVHAERVADFLEAAGIEANIRANEQFGGMLGAPGTSYVIEVSQDREAEAQQLLQSFPPAGSEPLLTPSESAPEEPAAHQLPGEISGIGPYRGASMLILLVSFAGVGVGVLQGTGVPVGVFASVIFDFLIWRRFTDPKLTLASAKKVRLFALTRLVIGFIISGVAVADGSHLAWLPLLLIAYAGFLFLQPLAETASAQPTAAQPTKPL